VRINLVDEDYKEEKAASLKATEWYVFFFSKKEYEIVVFINFYMYSQLISFTILWMEELRRTFHNFFKYRNSNWVQKRLNNFIDSRATLDGMHTCQFDGSIWLDKMMVHLAIKKTMCTRHDLVSTGLGGSKRRLREKKSRPCRVNYPWENTGIFLFVTHDKIWKF